MNVKYIADLLLKSLSVFGKDSREETPNITANIVAPIAAVKVRSKGESSSFIWFVKENFDFVIATNRGTKTKSSSVNAIAFENRVFDFVAIISWLLFIEIDLDEE